MTKLKIISFNAEGMSLAKAELISQMDADIICIQETHKASAPTKIKGMHLVIYQESQTHGSAIYVRDCSLVKKSDNLSLNGVEVLMLETDSIRVFSIYKPPPTPFCWPNSNLDDKVCVVIGDFNSHNTIWGYSSNNTDGERVEEWALANDLSLLHSAKDKPSFHSARWRRGYNPDLAFVSSRYQNIFQKSLGKPVPRSQHRPLVLELSPVVKPIVSKPLMRFNYNRANWQGFRQDLDSQIDVIPPVPSHYDSFMSLVWSVAKKNIPRGFFKQYVPGLDDASKQIYAQYTRAYESDPFADETIELGESLLTALGEARRERWEELVTSINMTHNSKKAWKTINKLSNNSQPEVRCAQVTPNQVATQLLLNGKAPNRERSCLKRMKADMRMTMESCKDEFFPFNPDELIDAIKHVKLGKACGLDGLSPDMILHFGDKTKEWSS